jgi:trimethylamine:corrinoid methyltransferase-like protein
MTTHQGHEAVVLDSALGLLDSAGRTSGSSTVAIDCLLAAEHVERAGGRASDRRRRGDTTRSIRSALKLLSTLDDDLLDDDDIQAAIQAALRALRSVG